MEKVIITINEKGDLEVETEGFKENNCLIIHEKIKTLAGKNKLIQKRVNHEILQSKNINKETIKNVLDI